MPEFLTNNDFKKNEYFTKKKHQHKWCLYIQFRFNYKLFKNPVTFFSIRTNTSLKSPLLNESPVILS